MKQTKRSGGGKGKGRERGGIRVFVLVGLVAQAGRQAGRRRVFINFSSDWMDMDGGMDGLNDSDLRWRQASKEGKKEKVKESKPSSRLAYRISIGYWSLLTARAT
jgi:hypothetical protein